MKEIAFSIIFLGVTAYLSQVFVLMQFDPGLEYKQVRGRTGAGQGGGTGGGGTNKDENS